MFRRFLAPIIATMLCFTGAVYIFAVPYLKNLVYLLEEKSVQTNLKNIHKLIEANALAIEAYKKSVLSAHKRQLKNITLFTETYLKNKYDQVQKGVISEDEAQLRALEELRAFRYGNNDYVWVADYQGYFLSHPDPKMNMEDFSQVRDVFGNHILTPLIQQAMKHGDGYNNFWWQRLENDLPAEKLAYAKIFPQWEWVIGTGVYLDDLETEIILRKEKMVEELRQILKPISIAENGYMYIFDSWHNIIIHPDADLENTDMSSWINPSTGNILADDIIAAAHKSDNRVAYKWTRPDDKRQYIYEKIDWVTHVDNFDWFVVASVYTDELNTSSVHLRDRIVILASLVVVFSIIIISVLMSRLLSPIRRLSYTAGLVGAGDLTARSEVKGADEIGFLASAFNSMISQLNDIIEKLDHKVLERTNDLNQANKKLTATVGKLEQHNWRVSQLNQMAKKLQSSHSLEEIYMAILESLSGLFPQTSGILYMCYANDHNTLMLNPVIKWGEHKHVVHEHSLHDCRSIKERNVFLFDMSEMNIHPCEHIHADPPSVSLCIPLSDHDEILGMVNIIFTNVNNRQKPLERKQMLENWQRLATSVEDQLAMALANMKLREKLQDLSVRDGLTGLFNRRYMEETLEREFNQADRSGQALGIIMLDVDFFKQFNDTYGHKAGDDVLVQLSNFLAKSIRRGDIVCRYGGEEFLMVLPNTSIGKTAERAEAIRYSVEKELKVRHNREWLPITISLGVAAYPDHGTSPEKVLKAADDALYRAKDQGRNRAIFA